jgi:hypothetical protein
MEQRRIARKHLHAGGSCWPSNFGLVTSEPRLCSFYSCSSTMQCPGRLSVTRQGARFWKRTQICLPEALKLQGCFLFIKVQRYWYNGVSPPSLARPCITAVFRISQQLADWVAPGMRNQLKFRIFKIQGDTGTRALCSVQCTYGCCISTCTIVNFPCQCGNILWKPRRFNMQLLHDGWCKQLMQMTMQPCMQHAWAA